MRKKLKYSLRLKLQIYEKKTLWLCDEVVNLRELTNVQKLYLLYALHLCSHFNTVPEPADSLYWIHCRVFFGLGRVVVGSEFAPNFQGVDKEMKCIPRSGDHTASVTIASSQLYYPTTTNTHMKAGLTQPPFFGCFRGCHQRGGRAEPLLILHQFQFGCLKAN